MSLAKAGQCPDVSDQMPSRCGQYCRHDGSCSGEMKCCSTSCGVDCLLPVTSRIDASSKHEKKYLRIKFDFFQKAETRDQQVKVTHPSCAMSVSRRATADSRIRFAAAEHRGNWCTMIRKFRNRHYRLQLRRETNAHSTCALSAFFLI